MRLQAEAEKEEITVTLNAVNSAQDTLKEDGMTEEDLVALRDGGIDWGNEDAGIMDFSSFLSMSYDEQKAYLDELETKTQEIYNTTNQ
jgi:hypothetical protein